MSLASSSFFLFEVFQYRFDGRKGMYEVERGQSRICGDVSVVVGVKMIGFSACIETVLRKVEFVFFGRYALNEQVESVETSDGLQFAARAGRLGDMVQLLAYELRIGSFEAVELHGVAVRAVAVQLHPVFEVLQVRSYTLNFGVVLRHGRQDGVQPVSARRLAAHERLTLAFERGDFLLQTGFFQQVGVARKDGDVFGEVHA